MLQFKYKGERKAAKEQKTTRSVQIISK